MDNNQDDIVVKLGLDYKSLTDGAIKTVEEIKKLEQRIKKTILELRPTLDQKHFKQITNVVKSELKSIEKENQIFTKKIENNQKNISKSLWKSSDEIIKSYGKTSNAMKDMKSYYSSLEKSSLQYESNAIKASKNISDSLWKDSQKILSSYGKQNDTLKSMGSFYRKQEIERNAIVKRQAADEATAKKMLNSHIIALENRLAATSSKIYQAMYNDRIAKAKQALSTMQNINKQEAQSIINETNKAQAVAKKAQFEYSRSASSVLSSDTGTTFGHKALTTSQYMIAGAALFKVQQAMSGVIRESVAYDDAIYSNMSVLRASRAEAENLADANRKLAVSYGGSIKEIDELSLTLGRAGVALRDIEAATKAGVELATITGDSFGDSAKVLSSFITNFGTTSSKLGLSVDEISTKLGFMANESKMATEDLGTFANYALVTAKSLGMTIDQTGALATTLSNIGTSASTIGTQMSKLDIIFTTTKSGMGEFWDIIGKKQSEYFKISEQTINGIKQEIKSVDISKFAQELADMDTMKFMEAISNVDILTKKMLVALRDNVNLLKENESKIANAFDISAQAQVKALSVSKMYERALNAVSISADGLLTNLADTFTNRDEIQAEIETWNKLNKTISSMKVTDEGYAEVKENLLAVTGRINKMSEESIDGYTTLGNVIKKVAVYTAEAGVAFLAYQGYMALLRTGVFSLIGSINGLQASMITTAALSRGLSLALNAIPFVAVAGVAILLTEAFFNNRKEAELLEGTYNKTAKELSKLSIAQIEYRKHLVETELIQQSVIMANAKARAANKGLFTSDEEHKKNQAQRDEEIAKYNTMLQASRDLKGALDLINETNGKNTSTSTQLNNIYKASKKTLEEIAEQETKNNILRIKGVDSKEYQLVLLNEELKKAKKIKDEIASTEENKLSILKADEDIIKIENKISEVQKKLNTQAISDAEKLAKLQDETSKARLDIAQISMSEYEKKLISITQKEQEWLKAKVDMQTVEEGTRALREQIDLERAIGIAKTELDYTKEKLSLQDKTLENELAISEIAYANRLITIASMKEEQDIINEMLVKEWELQQLRMNNIMNEDKIAILEEEGEAYRSLIDAQLGLTEATESWVETFANADDSITRMIGSFKNFSKVSLTYSKEKSKLDEKLRKAEIKYEKDTPKRLKAEQEYIKDNSALALTGIGELAGASKSFFSEQTTAYKVLQTIELAVHLAKMAHMAAELPGQITSLITNIGIGVSAQAAIPIAGFVLAPAMAALLLGLTGYSGGGSGGGSSSGVGIFEQRVKKIENEYQPQLDRLDRQIELLESIDRKGSAQDLTRQQANVEFTRDMRIAIETIDFKFLRKGLTRNLLGEDFDSIAKSIDELGIATKITDNKISITGRAFRDLDTGIETFLKYTEIVSGYREAFTKGVSINNNPKEQLKFDRFIEQIQTPITDFANSMVGVVNEMVDASDKFKDLYDDLTQSSKYYTKDLKKAREVVDKLTDGYTLSEYLEKQIIAIDAIEEELGGSINSLLSIDISNLDTQVKAVQMLNEKLGTSFQAGTQEALDYISSIEMVAEAMINSQDNINSWFDSLMDENQKLDLLSYQVGSSIAQSVEELGALFEKLSYDADGLTDIELEFLQSNKDYLERLAEQNNEAREADLDSNKEYLEKLKKNMTTIDSILKDIDDTVAKLRGSALDSPKYNLDLFYESMKKTQGLLNGDNYEALQESMKETIKLSSALSDKANFTLSRDMKYAQLVAANQFEAMEVPLQTERDLLSEIAKNTEETVLRLEESIKHTSLMLGQQLAQMAQQAAIDNANKQITQVAEKKQDEFYKELLTAEKAKAEAEKAIIDAKTALANSKLTGTYSIDIIDKILALGGKASGGLTAKESKELAGLIEQIGIEVGVGKKIDNVKEFDKVAAELKAQKQAQQYYENAVKAFNESTQKIEQLTSQMSDLKRAVADASKNASSIIASSPIGGANASSVIGDILNIKPDIALTGVTVDSIATIEKPILTIAQQKKLDELNASLANKKAKLENVTKASSIKKLEKEIAALEAQKAKLPSYAVGTPNVPNDMLANIHKGETIIPTTFSEGLRRGDLMLGETNQLSNLLVDVISKLNGIIIQQGLQTATLIESRDIQNGSLVMLENIEGII